MTGRAGLLLAAALLAVQLWALWWFVMGRLNRWPQLVTVDARYWRWCIKDLLAFAVPALIGLALLGRFGAVLHAPVEFARVQALLPRYTAGDIRAMIVASLIGLMIGTGVIALVSRWRRSAKPFGVIGDVGALMPRDGRELAPAALLAMVAGASEELAFRLWLPLLVTLLTGSPIVGFAVAAAVFGALHRYQGWAGVIGTTAVGLVLAFVYLSTGQLWLAMALHALLDLNALALRPVLTGHWRRD